MSISTEKKKVTIFRLVVTSVILFFVMMGYIFLWTGKLRALEVTSGSMEPTLLVGDRVLVSQYTGGEIKYGDLVVFESPDDIGPELVKRVVGVPGDHLRMVNGILYINDQKETTSEGKNPFNPQVPNFTTTIEPDTFFVLGDNRPLSHDSTEFGPIKRDLIHGLIWKRYSPWNRRGSVE